MHVKKLVSGISIFVCAALLATGSPALTFAADAAAKPAATKASDNVVKGKVMGVSKKAKTITIDTANGPVMVKFDEKTTGLDHAKKGEAAIVKFSVIGKDKVAVEVKPKLAKLPEGTTEIMPKDLAMIMAEGKDGLMLIDARPGARYAEAHIQGAVSIPVPKMKESGKTLLPQDNKDKLLVFYCGGPT